MHILMASIFLQISNEFHSLWPSWYLRSSSMSLRAKNFSIACRICSVHIRMFCKLHLRREAKWHALPWVRLKTIAHQHLEAVEDHLARELSGLLKSTGDGWTKHVSGESDKVSKELYDMKTTYYHSYKCSQSCNWVGQPTTVGIIILCIGSCKVHIGDCRKDCLTSQIHDMRETAT